MEAFIVPYLGGPQVMPASEDKFLKSRCDVAVRTTDGINYVVDATITDAALGPKPENYKHSVGKGTDEAFDEKVAQHVTRFPRIDIKTQFRAASWDIRGGVSTGTVAYIQEIARREHRAHPMIPYSVVASRMFQRLSVAIQRAVAYNTMEYRFWRVPVAVPGVARGLVAAQAPVPVEVDSGEDDE